MRFTQFIHSLKWNTIQQWHGPLVGELDKLQHNSWYYICSSFHIFWQGNPFIRSWSPIGPCLSWIRKEKISFLALSEWSDRSPGVECAFQVTIPWGWRDGVDQGAVGRVRIHRLQGAASHHAHSLVVGEIIIECICRNVHRVQCM